MEGERTSQGPGGNLLPPQDEGSAEGRLFLVAPADADNNVLRYSDPDKGPVLLTVSMSGGELVIEVQDHGPGFSEEQAGRICEPFFRGDPSRTRKTGGTGLGLYLTRLVAEAHGGTLSLREDYRDGACLVVRLPAGD